MSELDGFVVVTVGVAVLVVLGEGLEVFIMQYEYTIEEQLTRRYNDRYTAFYGVRCKVPA